MGYNVPENFDSSPPRGASGFGPSDTGLPVPNLADVAAAMPGPKPPTQNQQGRSINFRRGAQGKGGAEPAPPEGGPGPAGDVGGAAAGDAAAVGTEAAVGEELLAAALFV
jgi:hypothetical protein